MPEYYFTGYGTGWDQPDPEPDPIEPANPAIEQPASVAVDRFANARAAKAAARKAEQAEE